MIGNAGNTLGSFVDLDATTELEVVTRPLAAARPLGRFWGTSDDGAGESRTGYDPRSRWEGSHGWPDGDDGICRGEDHPATSIRDHPSSFLHLYFTPLLTGCTVEPGHIPWPGPELGRPLTGILARWASVGVQPRDASPRSDCLGTATPLLAGNLRRRSYRGNSYRCCESTK